MEKKKEEILKFMREESGRPLAFREIVRALDVRKDQRDSIKGFLKEMIADGALVRISGGRFGLPSKLNLITGELICHPDGYGFVRPEGGRGEDIFINPGRLNGAMHGDTVAARVEGVKSGGRKEGRIIRVIRRAHKTIVGRYEEGGKGFGAIIPSDKRITSEIIVPPGDRGNAAHGMIVSAEITRWPAKHIPAAGRVAEIIGEPEDPDVEAEVILRKFGLPHRFPAHVLHEAKGVPDSVGEEDIKGRVDLRGKTTVTIDGETAKDFDDAVSVEKTRHGFRLYVSIADVSRYVKEGTVIDTEAYARGVSVYFPGRCIPMLPEALSNGICSLNPRVDRLAMTAELEFDSNGGPVKKSFYESVINSVERLTYTTVKGLLSEGEGDSELKARYGHILEDIRLMRGLAEKLAVRRIEAGSIDFDLPEPQIIIDIEGRIEDIVRSERNVAHRIIEEPLPRSFRALSCRFSTACTRPLMMRA
ncbi:MAG: VacB/RNase II family 3'-5' exoribonuclease [Deltaproteobacteria bacterium]|nr:VacB/RNase II family 3'-5' exoribonuclease [Deltaproteobacteria bacterium]